MFLALGVVVALLSLLYFYADFFQHAYQLYYRLKSRRRLKKYIESNYSILDRFSDVVKQKPNCPYIYFQDDCYTFKQADELSNRAARALLQSGIGKGDVVAIFSPNSPMFVWTWLGLTKIGCVGAFLNYNIRSKSLLHCIKVGGAKLLVAAEELRDAVEEVLPSLQEQNISVLLLSDKSISGMENFTQKMTLVSSEPLPRDLRAGLNLLSPLVYIYTSGTTGLPKAVLINEAKLWHMCSAHISVGRNETEIVYVSLPLYHSVGFIGITGAIMLGSTVVLRNKFSVSNFWKDCRKYNVNTILYIGEILRYLCNTPESPSDREHNVKLAIGNGIRADVWREFLKRFGNIKVKEFYGATEGNFAFINNSGKIGAIGQESIFHKWSNPYALIKYDVDKSEPVRVADGFCVRVAKGEPGLLVTKITATAPFFGYVGDLKQTESKRLHDVFEKGDMYFNTGDMLITDEEGFVYFHDRVGDTFRWKGENVATTEVADILTMTECVQEANVYGVTVPGHEGRAGMAAVVLRGPKFDSRAVFKHVESLLPVYARPLFIRIQESLDITGTFKHQKMKLTEEGFDPKKISDTLYFFHAKENDYIPLTQNIYDCVVTGTIKV